MVGERLMGGLKDLTVEVTRTPKPMRVRVDFTL